GTLRLLVTEREPVAQVYTLQPRAKGGGYDPVVYHLDGAGYVIQPVDPRMRSTEHPAGNEHYPTITGVPASEMRPGRCIESRQLKAALELVQAFDSSPMVGLVGIGRIDLSVPEVLRVNTESGTEILFGLDGIDRQLARWRLIHDLGIKLGRSVASLDLSVTNNLPARWAEAEVLPSGSPAKPVKTTRTRKKNV
ncbi:MAG TPA: hypothetical protein VK968_02690, partial [Roseimicrobium sp.]|nr:hypothetical protein [Roseimicrobium sp.]